MGYFPLGVNATVELGLKETSEFVDIPVSAIGKGDYQKFIFIEIERWVPSLEIEEGQEEEVLKPQIEESDW